MKTIVQADYHTSILVPGTAENATRAISQVSSWWTENMSGPGKNQNDEFEVPFR